MSATTKQLLRAEVRKRIGNLLAEPPGGSDEVISVDSSAVCQQLFDHPWFVEARRLSVYLSTASEIQTDDIVCRAFGEGKQIFIPRFQRGQERMELLKLESEKELDGLRNSTLWGIRQHPHSVQPQSYSEGVEDGQNALDLVIVPGLAFTVDGKRLGHGRGYYDRFLYEYEERHGHRPRTIGLALRAQLLDDLPMERWDRRLDLVLHPPLEKHG